MFWTLPNAKLVYILRDPIERIVSQYIHVCASREEKRSFEDALDDLEVGLQIIQALRGHTTGFAIPQFVIDAPGGGGKIPLMPEYIKEFNHREVCSHRA